MQLIARILFFFMFGHFVMHLACMAPPAHRMLQGTSKCIKIKMASLATTGVETVLFFCRPFMVYSSTSSKLNRNTNPFVFVVSVPYMGTHFL